MTKFSDRLPPNMETIMRELEALRGEVREMRAARRLEAATIGGGGITIQGGAIVLKDASGNEFARMGVRDDLIDAPDGKPQPGFIIRRNDGSVAFTVDDPNPNSGGYKQFLKIQDASGNVIFSEDADSGFGMSSPQTVGGVFYPSTDMLPGSNSTSLFQVMTAQVVVYHPTYSVAVAVLVPGTAGVTGTADLRVNGVSQGVRACPNNTFANYSWQLDGKALSGGQVGTTLGLDLLVSRSGGTSADYVRVSPNSIVGRS